MGGGNSSANRMDRINKQKAVMAKPVSTQSSSVEVVEGHSIESVHRASKGITTVIEQAVKNPRVDYSHFISLPLAIHPQLLKKLYDFQNTVLEEKQVKVKIDDATSSADASRSSSLSDLGIERSIFINPKTFHLTVLMLKLCKESVASATEVLQSISSDILKALDHRPIYISLKGLDCMKGSPANVRVLYAPVEEIGGEGRLQRACQVIIHAYAKAGLILEEDAHNSLKLHATLMNVRHRKRNSRVRRRGSFDGRTIFRRFGSENWGDYLIGEVHLSERFNYDESGYYHCCSSVSLPGGARP